MKNRIIRSASDTAAPATGNLVKIDTPKYLSLVGKPANQRPFPVIRSVQEPAPKGRIVRTKRGDNAVLMLTFPEGYTEDDVAQSLVLFGMEGYAVSTDGTAYYARRSDLQSITNVEVMKTEQVRITSDGIMACIDGAQYVPKAAASVAGITLSSFEFDRKTFDTEQIISWCNQNGVDISSDGIENPSIDVSFVNRTQVNEGTEVRRLALDTGVVAVIHRSDCCNVPDMFAGPVTEAAYGNYGWGQLDFNAAMADVAFCDQLGDAEYRVRSVLDQILFWSELPLDTRKTLVTRCLQQYGAFINDAIDALPRQVLQLSGVAARADLPTSAPTAVQTITQEKAAMKIDPIAAQKELDQLVATRQADEAAAAALVATAATATVAATTADTAADAPAAAADVPLTRADIAAMISTGFADALAAHAAASQETIVIRAATADTAATAAAVAASAPASTTVAAATITREDIAALLAEQLKPIGERMERIEGTTILRSDSGDGKQIAPTKESVFRGAFGNISKLAQQ